MSRVALLKGGRSLERQVSLRSGAQVQDALERLGHDVCVIDVGPDLVERLEEARADVAFVALHGRGGEDGTVQELLDLVGLPYTGSGPAACIRCMDKVVSKHAMRDAGIPTPDFYSFSETAFRELGAAKALPAIEARLEFPVVVKPAGQGSALGIKFAATAADVPGALVAAFSYDTRVILERHVAGRDLAVSVIDGPGGPEALPLVEAIPRDEDFYDFEARYEIGRTDFRCPADVGDSVTASAQELALGVYRLLGCYGFARIDLMLDEASGELQVLEANAIPGLTETSLLPQAAEAAGISFDALIERVLDLALARATRRRRTNAGAARQIAAPTDYCSPAWKSSGETWSRNSLNLSTTSSVSSTSCSNSIADSAITSSAAKIGAPERTASARASLGRESISTSRPLIDSVIDA